MILTIPRPALGLGLAGVAPFFLSAFALWIGWELDWAPYFWRLLAVTYGLGILCFMSGCIWAFAAPHGDATGYALSTLPCLLGIALFVFVGPFGEGTSNAILLGFIPLFLALLPLDYRAKARGQAPEWWMHLRLLLTSLVILCLLLISKT